jgi:peroxiredoxin Q/BCP
MLNEGDLAPDFELATDGGGSLKLSDLLGKRVVLYFYPKDDTSGCTRQACGFRDNKAALTGKNAIVIGVSPDGVASHDRFRDKYELNFPLLSDPDHSVAEAYGAWGKKKMYGREYDGVLRSTFVIDAEGRIAKIYAKVKAAENAQQVLEDLSS